MPFLDEIDEWAAEAGAVNTIVNRGGRLIGYNTDGYGFLRALRESAGLDPAGKRALILGAGGSARGVVQALLRAEVADLVIANPEPWRGPKRWPGLSTNRGVPARAVELGLLQSTDTAVQPDLIVNCTSLGMHHGPDEGRFTITRITDTAIRPGLRPRV